MSTISARIMEDLKTAMKAKDQTALATLRALKAAIMNATIEKHGAGGELGESDSVAVVRKQVKQRQDSIESFEKAGRSELADNEKAEIAILESYLPPALSEDEIGAMIDEAIAETGATSKKEMGAVMKIVQAKAAGRADGKALSQAVMSKLS